ncbi:AAA family ATPase [Acinetobacter rudis]|uniref:AAA family ATPase n=1 Tax=Acinetobacter rudis TaxID=632955 RepID=A0AAW8J8F3_9GAMM|nr:AAA family ATPase [Acinetobacter rudis]MDQ8935737.1 AAA family ATPase [Acinetobacter rudis]MDQ8952125.1 AAA family ATPase [Acinetobacter rudis]MDQ9018062.1 AAA family ATPase [Acinetobacter rudis]
MTFASARLQENQELIEQQQYKQQSQMKSARTSRFKFEPDQVMQTLRQKIVGQDAALDEIEKMLRVVKADFNPADRPLAVTLMLGPTGVGKTETVRLISEALNGRADAFCRIDMNTLAQEHYAAALTGAPPGYVGSKEGNTLFDAEIIQGSFSKPGIVLFDEIEKASTEVIRALLNVIETGKLKLTAGTKSLDFCNCLIFMTSNVGAQQSQHRLNQLLKLPKFMRSIAQHFDLDDHALTEKALLKKFDPEFINRIDRILHFNRVETDFIPGLIQIELDKLNQRLQKQGRQIYLADSARRALAQGYDIRYGARGVGRKIRTQLEPALAYYLLLKPESNEIYVEYGANGFKLAAYSE